jgi:DNA-binding GntR family transcriptional regulator
MSKRVQGVERVRGAPARKPRAGGRSAAGGAVTGRRTAAVAPPLTEQARTRLEEMILVLELPPGSVWSEAQLSSLIGIGRTPVREALQRLQTEHLVSILPRHGARITDINVTQQLLLLEVRRALERLIAISAARRATAEEREELHRIADRLERMKRSDILEFLRFDHHVKAHVAACARNPYATRAIAPTHSMSRRFYYLHYRTTHDLPVAAGHHARVVRAIAVGDETLAGAAADRLMDYVDELTRATVMKP